MTRQLFAILALISLYLTPARSRADFDAAADFSASNNPNGVWSFGYSTTLGGAFIPYTEHGRFLDLSGNATNLDAWQHNISLGDPGVFYNGTSQPVTVSGAATWQPGQLGFHPGPHGENSIVRFTAPVSTSYSLAASFVGLDFAGPTGPTSTDVHVFLNGVSLFNGSVSQFGTGPGLSRNINVSAGDHLDFIVGFGADGNFADDSTGIAAHLGPAAVPEPSSVVLLGAGFSVVVCVARRRMIDG